MEFYKPMESKKAIPDKNRTQLLILLAGVVVAIIVAVVLIYVSELNDLMAEKLNLPPALSKLAEAYETVARVVEFITNLLPQR
jgi:flagellar basal body-associated protein FliL